MEEKYLFYSKTVLKYEVDFEKSNLAIIKLNNK